MIKKLNESINKTRLRLLSFNQLSECIHKMLDNDETDEQALEQLSSEVQRRLSKATKPEARTALQEIADRIYRYRLMRTSQEDDDSNPRLDEKRLKRKLFDLKNDDFFDKGGGGVCMCSVPDGPADFASNSQKTACRKK